MHNAQSKILVEDERCRHRRRVSPKANISISPSVLSKIIGKRPLLRDILACKGTTYGEHVRSTDDVSRYDSSGAPYHQFVGFCASRSKADTRRGPYPGGGCMGLRYAARVHRKADRHAELCHEARRTCGAHQSICALP